ncbi:DNA replication ATP-dependent helicase/nuclease DNA2 isoform X2 [Aedes aegypti]|uniref:DNA replication ATP-dependent helicase/nuclease n=1 Tax=Aedes aegypti TaxID=7159 RepID=A0A6I8T2Z6_AEDAE|nr:DNA replication ATP-dependent helicase/nuclease DNA2 isoform X2 [Aedes aegypti]
MDKNTVFKRSFNNLDLEDSDVENASAVSNSQPLAKKLCLKEQISGAPNDKNEMDEFGDDLDCFFGDDDNFDLDLMELNEAEKFVLDLTTWKRCKIVSLCTDVGTVTLVVEDKIAKTKAKCILEPPWISVQLSEGSTVSLKATFDRTNNVYRINAQDGMIVTNPDHLVSGTTVVGALYCHRRGVLQERFRGVDTDSQIMTVGTIVHEVLQKTLRNKLTDLSDIVAAGQELLNSEGMAHVLYACKMSRQEAMKEIESFYPKIHDFIKNHVHLAVERTVSRKPKSDIEIFAIKDIEENIWCHQLGLKGKIDVTVEAKCSGDKQVQLMPLELKTGRASFSAEHKGQVVLYEMMMNIVGHHVDKGILLYLREGKCASVVGNRNMKRDLIMLRNEVAHFLSRGIPNTDSAQFDLTKDILPLPEPLNNQHVCSRCPYSVICTTYLRHEKREFPDGHAIKLISEESLSHLSDQHIDYFIRWAGLIFLEDEEARKGFHIKHLWTKTPEVRHAMGRAAINLRLTEWGFKSNDTYFHTFSLDADKNDSLNVSHSLSTSQLPATENLSMLFEVNEYLICSTSNRIAVASGRVVSVGKRQVTINLERDLSKYYAKEMFHLDKYTSRTQMTFNLTNIGVLLDNSERSDKLRRIIIDRERPTFTRTVPAAVSAEAKQILQNLNKHQKIAVLTAVGTKTYCLFKGLPGTGKTQTVIALIRLLVAMNKSILITSNTHSAVDNVLLRLLTYNIKFMRLGSVSRINPALTEFSENRLTENCSTPEELAAVYNSHQIVGVTCLGADHPMLVQRTFDFCIVDEATQVFQSAVIRPLLSSDKFVLIGDPDQLPPVIKSRKAKDLGADESLFFRLDAEQSCCVLPTQYRMNKIITKLANDFSYKGKLLCATEEVANSSVKLPMAQLMQQKHKSEKWLLRTIASHLELSVVLINTLNTFKSSQTYNASRKRESGEQGEQPKAIYENYCEAAIVIYVIMALVDCGIDGSSIGVIAPFRAQVEQVLKRIWTSKSTP